jgi:hypothetical protein
MLEGLNLKYQLPKAIDGGYFCLTDGEALVAELSGATLGVSEATRELLAST